MSNLRWHTSITEAQKSDFVPIVALEQLAIFGIDALDLKKEEKKLKRRLLLLTCTPVDPLAPPTLRTQLLEISLCWKKLFVLPMTLIPPQSRVACGQGSRRFQLSVTL